MRIVPTGFPNARAISSYVCSSIKARFAVDFWLKAFGGRPVFVGYPAAFDFSFVYWYLTEFAGENPFGYSAIDIKTYAMALLRKPYRACGKQSMPPEWFDPVPHTHVALDDAIEQGQLFCNMLKANFGA